MKPSPESQFFVHHHHLRITRTHTCTCTCACKHPILTSPPIVGCLNARHFMSSSTESVLHVQWRIRIYTNFFPYAGWADKMTRYMGDCLTHSSLLITKCVIVYMCLLCFQCSSTFILQPYMQIIKMQPYSHAVSHFSTTHLHLYQFQSKVPINSER